MTEEIQVGTPTPNVPAPLGASAPSGANVPAPKRASKLFTILGGFLILTAVAAAGYFYVWPKLMGHTPPSLEVDTGQLAQGMLKEGKKGFAEFEGNEAVPATCNGEKIILPKGVDYIYSTTPITFEDVYKSLKPDAGLTFLFAFYSPEEIVKAKVNSADVETKYDQATFYLYPTKKSVYKDVVDVKLENGSKYVIPPYRGFVALVTKDAVLCGGNFKEASSNLKLENDDFVSAVKSLATVPEGWVLLPLNVFSKDNAPLVGIVYGTKAVTENLWLQSNSATAEEVPFDKFKNIGSDSNLKAKIEQSLAWVYMDESVDMVKFVNDVLKTETVFELSTAVYSPENNVLTLTFNASVKIPEGVKDYSDVFQVYKLDKEGKKEGKGFLAISGIKPDGNVVAVQFDEKVKPLADGRYRIDVKEVTDEKGKVLAIGSAQFDVSSSGALQVEGPEAVAPIIDGLDYAKRGDGLGYVNVRFSENVKQASTETLPLFTVSKKSGDPVLPCVFDKIDKVNVTLKCDPPLAEGTYSIFKVEGIVDESGNKVDLSNSKTEFTVEKDAVEVEGPVLNEKADLAADMRSITLHFDKEVTIVESQNDPLNEEVFRVCPETPTGGCGDLTKNLALEKSEVSADSKDIVVFLTGASVKSLVAGEIYRVTMPGEVVSKTDLSATATGSAMFAVPKVEGVEEHEDKGEITASATYNVKDVDIGNNYIVVVFSAPVKVVDMNLGCSWLKVYDGHNNFFEVDDCWFDESPMDGGTKLYAIPLDVLNGDYTLTMSNLVGEKGEKVPESVAFSASAPKAEAPAEPAEPVLAKVQEAKLKSTQGQLFIVITFDKVVAASETSVVKLYRVKEGGAKDGEVNLGETTISFGGSNSFGEEVYVDYSETLGSGEYIVEVSGFTDYPSEEPNSDVVDPVNNWAKFTVE